MLTACNQQAESSSHQADSHQEKRQPTKTASSVPLVTIEDKFEVVAPKRECSKPVVIEFFAYHCVHCFSLEPDALAWREKHKDKVDFIAIPTDLGQKQAGIFLLIHHAAKKVGVLDKAQIALFKRFHEEKKLFNSAEEVAEFLAAFGADKAEALAALEDREYLEKSLQHDFALLKDYSILAVPRILVNHRYMTDPTRAGGVENIFKVVDQLLTKEHNCK